MDTSDIVAIDTETTGLLPHVDELMSVALVPLDGSDSLEVFIDHRFVRWSQKAATYFDGYEKRWTMEKIRPSVAYARIQAFFSAREKTVLCGHNVGFDISFLNTLLPTDCRWHGLDYHHIDTATVVRYKRLCGKPAPAKTTLRDSLLFWDVENFAPHTAIGDAKATAELCRKLLLDG